MPKWPSDFVRNRRTFEGGDHHAPHGFLARLLDARRHFVRLAITPTDFASAVTDDDHGGEAEAATTFDHRRTAANRHDVLGKLTLNTILRTGCHDGIPWLCDLNTGFCVD